MKFGRWCCLVSALLGVLAGLLGSCSREPPASEQACDAPAKQTNDFETMKALRKCGWQMLSTIAEKPIVDSPGWVPRRDAFLEKPGGAKQTKGLTLFFTAEVADRLNGTDPVLTQPAIYESTFFNQTAYRHIRDEKYPLYEVGTVKKLMDESRGEIPEFPKDAVVLKTFWRPVPDQGSVNVGVWKWSNIKKDVPRLLETMWPDPVCVEVHPAAGSPCLNAKDRFYSTTTTETNSPDFLCLGGSNHDCAPELPKGTTMILVAMHIASKTKPDWFWATFWWQGVQRQNGASSANASWTCDNAQRPSEFDTGVWSNYSMDVRTSFNFLRPHLAPGDEMCGSPPPLGQKSEERLATYNPFIEGTVLLGFKSSCIDCHSRAYTGSDHTDVPQLGDTGGPRLADFQGHIRTDYLWSVNNTLVPPKKK